MSQTLEQIRDRMRIAGRNIKDISAMPNAYIDEAADGLFGRFQRVTRCVKTSSTVAFTTANTADFSGLSGFLASRIISVRVDVDANYSISEVRQELRRTDAQEVRDRLVCTSTDTPRMMAFTSATAAIFYPTPKANGTLTVLYAPLHIPWPRLGTRGTYSSSVKYVPWDVVISSGTLYRAIITNTGVAVATTTTWENLGAGTLIAPSAITSAIPDGLLVECIKWGGMPFLQSPDPEHSAVQRDKWQQYLDFESATRGIGNIAGTESIREMRG